MRNTHLTVGLLVLSVCAGCGTNINEALLAGAESGTRTFLDILVSDLVSDLPNLFSIPPGSTDGSGNGGDDGPPGDGGNGGDPTGDPGELIFTANSCGACHCADASGGCFPGATSLIGADAATLSEWLRGDTPHTGGKLPDLTDQDLADLEAYLAGLGG